MSLIFSKLSKAAWQRECQGCIKHLKTFLVTFPFCFVATEPLWDLFLCLKQLHMNDKLNWGKHNLLHHNACLNTLAEKLNYILTSIVARFVLSSTLRGKQTLKHIHRDGGKKKKSPLDLSEMVSESKCLNKSLHKCFLMNATIWDVG